MKKKHHLAFAILQPLLSRSSESLWTAEKRWTAQSYRFFVEHAYNQFFQHEAFHQSATERTKVREFAIGEFHTSTKLEGYVWIAGERKMAHVPKGQADDVDMEDHDEDADEELDLLPRLQVFVEASGKEEGRKRCKLSSERGNTNRRGASRR